MSSCDMVKVFGTVMRERHTHYQLVCYGRSGEWQLEKRWSEFDELRHALKHSAGSPSVFETAFPAKVRAPLLLLTVVLVLLLVVLVERFVR